mmetsp:Transcript_1854/g.6724  ORF Transcript_1854/g.6724 Transcript_1854/m.6724 type:complete len:203 (+) Transcript_1854:211-819(+)
MNVRIRTRIRVPKSISGRIFCFRDADSAQEATGDRGHRRTAKAGGPDQDGRASRQPGQCGPWQEPGPRGVCQTPSPAARRQGPCGIGSGSGGGRSGLRSEAPAAADELAQGSREATLHEARRSPGREAACCRLRQPACCRSRAKPRHFPRRQHASGASRAQAGQPAAVDDAPGELLVREGDPLAHVHLAEKHPRLLFTDRDG